MNYPESSISLLVYKFHIVASRIVMQVVHLLLPPIILFVCLLPTPSTSPTLLHSQHTHPPPQRNAYKQRYYYYHEFPMFLYLPISSPNSHLKLLQLVAWKWTLPLSSDPSPPPTALQQNCLQNSKLSRPHS